MIRPVVLVALFLVVGSAAAACTLLVLVDAVLLAELLSPSPVVVAVVLGTLAALLTTFTGCASLPTTEAFTRARDVMETARDRHGRRQHAIQLQLEEVERLAKHIEEEASKTFGIFRRDRGRITRWAQEIDELKEQIDTEQRSQLCTVDTLMQTATAMIERAEEVKVEAEALLRRSNVELPTTGDQARTMLGWTELMGGLDAVLDRARARLEAKQGEQAWLRRWTEGAAVALVRLGELASEVGCRPTTTRVRALRAQARALVAGHTELLHLAFANGWGEVTAVADFIISNHGPTLVLRTSSGPDRATVRLAARIRLDEATIGSITRGDVLVLSLPRGLALGAPLTIEGSSGLELRVLGNEAGSQAVTLEVLGDVAVVPKVVLVEIDQELSVEPGASLGWASAWSLARNTGVTLPVAVLPG